MKRIASRVSQLDVFGQRQIGREGGSPIITEEGGLLRRSNGRLLCSLRLITRSRKDEDEQPSLLASQF